jgi:RNA polymerase sigma-70 factor (ECF subfamily)
VAVDDRPDADLVSAARGGDREAAAHLVRRHWRRAWRRAYAITGRSALADDVAQDAMATALERLHELGDADRFGPWLGTIAARRALDALRADGRIAPIEAAPEPVAEWVGLSGDGAEVRRAVAALPPERRVPIVMRFWLDHTPSEIAAVLGLPVGTVNSRLARGLADLRRLLEGAPRA